MADYFAVLDRTLSGFGSPNAQLRTKLYERARITIRKQLDGRKPPVEPSDMMVEMEKLEQAIADIETRFGNEVPLPVSGGGEPAVETPAPPPVAEPAPAPEELVAEIPTVAEEAPVADETLAEPAELEAVPDITILPETPEQIAPSEPAAPEEPAQSADLISEALSEFTQADDERKQVVPPSDISEADEVSFDDPATLDSDVPDELLATPEFEQVAVPELEPVAEEFPEPLPEPIPELIQEPVLEPAIDPAAEFSIPTTPLPSVDFGAVDVNDSLAIPPAPGFEGGLDEPRGSGGWMKWLLTLIILGGLGFAAWAYQGPILDQINQWRGIEDPTKPKPVKTISIKPEPVQPEPSTEGSQVEPIVQPKSEQRLTDSGEEVVPAAPAAEPIPVVEPVVAEPAKEQQATKPGTESAILYEQGADDNSSKSDAGRTTWSLIQESPSPGEPTEAAIRAQIEIPDRKTVLIMTIKRNTDPALSASHLIELVFAVPDNFSGGSIEEINRFVLKQSEQGRGDPLAAVPVKIADGIFLIALDNVDAARNTNATLLKSRSWIDIPVRYRTGRKALVTIEKGASGEKVFDDAFADWATKQ